MKDTQLFGTANSIRSGKNSNTICLVSFLLCLTVITAACGSPQSTSSPSTPSSKPAAGLKISTPATQAIVGIPYNAVSTVSGGAAPYAFRLVSGTLPPGLSINTYTGSITGTPSLAGAYGFVLLATDARSDATGTTSAQIVVSTNGSGVGMSISPTSATVASEAQQQFTAQMSGTSSTAVSWATSAGTISSNGAFTAPQVTNNTAVTITATNLLDASTHAAATVTVIPKASLAVVGETLPLASVSLPYTASLSATGGMLPYQWSLASGLLPSGIDLQPASGAITGMTSVAGSYPFTAKVTDSSGQSATLALTLTVSSAAANGYDGPAELPLVYIQTALSNTPAPGHVTTVNAGGDLQSALNNANCGDTIELQAAATFTGTFTFPAKSCDDAHWIIVRTNSADSLLPAEGSRLTPCYAGVSSLPGRPAFNCASTKNVVAKLLMSGGGSGPIVFAAGANHYRLMGLEITRMAGTGIIYSFASITSGGTANNLIFDRVWMHGTAQDETTRGIELGGSTYVSVIDSFFTDFHCISVTGACTDSQTINGGLGNDQMGPYKITDNFLEAAGENILFGGGAATLTPTDIQISQNHMFKPMTWLKGQPGFVGGANGNPFVVKNHIELKNAQRVLVDGNIMEDTWGGYTQVGFGVLLTPKNPGGTTPCPMCQVTDVTVRYSTISHVGAGLQIANGAADAGTFAFDGERYSIHDITIDDIDAVKFIGPGEFAQVSVSAGAPLLQNVTINHVTAFPAIFQFIIGDQVGPNAQMKNFVFTNSIVNAGTNPLWSTGLGGTANCAVHDSPLTTLNACFSNYTFSPNAIVALPPNYPATTWPSGNYFPATVNTVQFVNYQGGIGGDYQLLPSSPYAGKGSDGKDLGADIAAINTAIAGVY
jgi:hypothetical protein